MKKRIRIGLLTSLLLFTTALPGYTETSPEQMPILQNASRQCPAIPDDLAESVQRVFPTKQDDLFVVLKNGLTLLVRRKSENDIVSAQVFVRAGSIYEGRHLTAGLSHYLEHVVSGGSTSTFTEAQAKERLQLMGGVTNAYTSHDRTVYYINTSGGHWQDALDLLLSYVSENSFDPREVTREKAVIQQEIKLGENDPDRELWKLFIQTAYSLHPVRNPVIGYEEVFVKLDREALRSYYLDRYQPENIVVAVAGNVDPLKVIEFVSKKTANFKRGAVEPSTIPDEPFQMSPRWAETEVPVARLFQVMLGFPSVSLHNKDLYAMDVLAFLMGEGQTSRLYRRLKDEEKKVLSIGASNWTPSFVQGQFMISLTLAPQYWPGVLKNIREEIDRFKNETVSAEELNKAKKAAIAQHVFERESASAMASSLASSFFDTGDAYFNETYIDKLRMVTPEDIRDVAWRYLQTDRMNVAVVRPPGSQETPAADQAAPQDAASEAAPVVYNRLENGLKILLKQNDSLPMVTIQLYGLGGLLLEDSQNPGISLFASSLLTAGTKTRSKLEILKAIENVGGGIEAKSDNNTYHISIQVLKEDLGMALDILSDIVTNSEMPDDEIEKTRNETLLALKTIDEHWQSEIMRMFKKNYFQQSPYQHDRPGTVESVNSFTRENLLKFFRRMVNPAHSVLAVYGDLNPEETIKIIQTKFNSWHGESTAVSEWPDETRRIASSQTVEKKNEKSSAALFIGANGIDINDPRRPVMDVLDALLAGASYPGGRLFEALRGKENLVYVVSALAFSGKKAGYFGVITQTTLANLDKVQKIILENLRELSDNPVPATEIATAKDMLLISRGLGMESLAAQAKSAAVNEVLDLGWKYDLQYPELIRAVTVEEVQKLAKEIFANTLIVRTLPEHPVEIMAPRPIASDVQTR
ncbi:MAG: M16 family metallopeptidase [Syntrophobacteraceae bacterium]